MNLSLLLGDGGIRAAMAILWLDKAAFMGVFALLILVLICLPSHLGGQAEGRTRWWRNVRLWAILIALIQMLVYAWWG